MKLFVEWFSQCFCLQYQIEAWGWKLERYKQKPRGKHCLRMKLLGFLNYLKGKRSCKVVTNVTNTFWNKNKSLLYPTDNFYLHCTFVKSFQIMVFHVCKSTNKFIPKQAEDHHYCVHARVVCGMNTITTTGLEWLDGHGRRCSSNWPWCPSKRYHFHGQNCRAFSPRWSSCPLLVQVQDKFVLTQTCFFGRLLTVDNNNPGNSIQQSWYSTLQAQRRSIPHRVIARTH